MSFRPAFRWPVVQVLALLLTCGLAGALTAALPGRAAAVDGPSDVYTYLENPGMVAEGQVAPHSRLWPYADEASAVRAGDSPYVRSLDGAWKFKLADTPSLVPAGYQQPGFDTSGWSTVQVPHTWQSDFLDHPMFRNIPEEVWPDAPPRVPRDVNPTGAYVKSFDIPAGESGRRQLVRFEGVTSGYFVWVNGKYIGYDQGGYSPAEFDITSAVKPGRNTLAVQVHRWGSGSYLEDYDQWRYAGIFRDVFSYSVPEARIQDAYVTTDLDAAYRDATLAVDASVEGAGAGYQVSAVLRDPRGQVVTTLTGAAGSRLSGVVSNPSKWSDETPTLYSLVLALKDPSGKVVHRTSQKVGFREIEVRDKQILLNGKRILFRGVNRSETDPETGRHITHAAMEKDVQLMKKLHVNAVRTSHYESDPYWYELADRYGLLIDDEVDIETHAHESCPSVCLASKPEWQAAYHDRFVAMVERDKNHPSVVFWDTGNEAGLGTAHYAMASWADANEPTRLLYHQSNSPDGDAPYADVAGPRYPTPASLENKAKTFTKPIVMGEYAHAMGNGLGNFDQFWALARKYPSMQGGFIWDWAEQNLAQPLKLTPDSSPRSTQAFFVGKPALGAGHQGQGVELSSLDDFVDVFRDPSLDVSDGLSLDAWVKPGSWTGSFPILTKGQQYALQMVGASTLEFRVTVAGQEKAITAAVPADWVGSWHRVTGTYDGSALVLYVDGAEVARTAVTGKLEPGLWEVNVGRNAQTQQDQVQGRLAHGTFDQIRILPKAMTSSEVASGVDLRSEAVLALDFEKVVDAGRFQSLGISLSGTDGLVGTDRYLQPETVEMAWAQSPVRFSSASPGVVTVRNEQQFAPLTFDLRWAVRQADAVIRQGSVPVTLPPDSSRVVTLPVAADNPRSLERFLSLDAVSARLRCCQRRPVPPRRNSRRGRRGSPGRGQGCGIGHLEARGLREGLPLHLRSRCVELTGCSRQGVAEAWAGAGCLAAADVERDLRLGYRRSAGLERDRSRPAPDDPQYGHDLDVARRPGPGRRTEQGRRPWSCGRALVRPDDDLHHRRGRRDHPCTPGDAARQQAGQPAVPASRRLLPAGSGLTQPVRVLRPWSRGELQRQGFRDSRRCLPEQRGGAVRALLPAAGLWQPH